MVTPKKNWHDRELNRRKEDDKLKVGEPKSVVPTIITKKSKDFKKLSMVCEPITKDDDIEYYKALLMTRLRQTKIGVGLSLNQIGIMKSMALVNVIKPVYLINPELINKSKPILFREGCLSFPNKLKLVQRYTEIEVKTMQHEGSLIFSGASTGMANDNAEKRTLEAICVQHEINHLNGETIYDVTCEPKQMEKEGSKIGRNECCHCGSGKKYKRCCL